jgi:hypothetical protein
MITVSNDFNKMEGRRGKGWAVVLHEEHTPPEVLVPGTRIIVSYPGEMECEAIVEHGKYHRWVAKIIEETFFHFDV